MDRAPSEQDTEKGLPAGSSAQKNVSEEKSIGGIKKGIMVAVGDAVSITGWVGTSSSSSIISEELVCGSCVAGAHPRSVPIQKNINTKGEMHLFI